MTHLAAAQTAALQASRMSRGLVSLALTILVTGTLLLWLTQSGRMAALFALGAFLGLALIQAGFGFTIAWRRFLADRRGAGMRAQMLMLALGCILFFPTLEAGDLFGRSVGGFVAPLSTAVLVGAFLFGIGMQLGGGCGSGTLVTVGGGNLRMVVTLAAFVTGSVIATAHLPWWRTLPSAGSVSLVRDMGAGAGLAVVLPVFLAIALATWWLERARHGPSPFLRKPGPVQAADWWHGPWPLVAGAVGLAVGNYLSLAVAGHPWGVTSGFTMWGGQIATALGVPIGDWPWWQNNRWMLNTSVFASTVSVMNFGLLVGSFLAAGLAATFNPNCRIPPRSLLAAILGGLLLGYGARLAYGCNIGALFSGIVSGSLHGWLWMAAALAGNVVGIVLRPVFGLAVERSAR